MISKQLICVFWIMCLSVGLFEVIFTPLKEVGIVSIYMSIMGLLREIDKPAKTNPLDFDKRILS